MNSNFDIDKVGKRMPYKMRDDLFEEMETHVASQLGIKDASVKQLKPNSAALNGSHKTLKIAGIATIMAAACLALCFVLYRPQDATIDMQDIEDTYAMLSETDQDYLLEVYQDDILLEEDE